jgi:glutamyl-tRNA synthetase
MHIGNARTALYNWLYAKRHGGKFVVRIEDTDRARHSEEAVLAIINGLEWLGLDHDGDIVSQFERRDRHVEIANKLLEEGKAYYCYCSPEELQDMREKSKKEGKSTVYDRRWRDKDPSDAPKDIDPVVRIKAPLEGETVIKDHVQGEVRIANETIDDFIILRSDGTPTYMLSVVVDDHDMGITHIIRGDDHLNNAFRQKVIIDAMGWNVPKYAHSPLIHGPDGGKFSKRHGAQSVEEYKEMGYLPEAMRNYLLRLGWSHGDDEIISTEQAVEWFNLENIGKAPARFDFAKLSNINAHYINIASPEYLLDLMEPFLLSRHELQLDDVAKERILAGMKELQERAKDLLQLTDEAAFYAKSVPFDFDEKAGEMLQKEGAKEVLIALKDLFVTTSEISSDTVEENCRNIAEKFCDGKLGKVAMPLRAALTGTTVSPSIFHAAAILGQKEVIKRLDGAIEKFAGTEKENVAASN